jgi:hypothetical protein
MKFLDNLQYPERNDREWFKLHDPSYRLAEKVPDDSIAPSRLYS